MGITIIGLLIFLKIPGISEIISSDLIKIFSHIILILKENIYVIEGLLC